MTDFGVLERSHDSIRRIKSDIYAQNLKLALGVGKPEEELVLKKVKVVMVWCSMTMVGLAGSKPPTLRHCVLVLYQMEA